MVTKSINMSYGIRAISIFFERSYAYSMTIILIAALGLGGPALADTFHVTSSQCSGPNSIVEAMDQANANPGLDTISIQSGLTINGAQCPSTALYRGVEGKGDVILTAKESVVIEGNGATIKGSIVWIDHTGIMSTGSCPRDGSSQYDVAMVAFSPGFIQVGQIGQDSSAVTVTLRNLSLYELDAVAEIYEGATLVVEDSHFERIISAGAGIGTCRRAAVLAESGANFTARRTEWRKIFNFGEVIDGRFGNPVIAGSHAGNLAIEESTFHQLEPGGRAAGGAGAVGWWGQDGSTADIVSSHFYDGAGGYIAQGTTTTNIVNSVWDFGSYQPLQESDRFANLSKQPLNVIASTMIYGGSSNCDPACQLLDIGWIFRDAVWSAAGPLNFVESVVSDAFPNINDPTNVYLRNGRLLWGGPDDTQSEIYADQKTYITPTDVQPIDVIKVITHQPALVTGSPALETPIPYFPEQNATPAYPGVLVDVIDNAECGQSNALINPIDGSCITKDVFGHDRVDANGKRNIGAVQLKLAPHVDVVATDSGTVDLQWTRPLDLPSGALTGYRVEWREQGAGSWQSVSVPDPATLAYQVTGLTNGTTYEFQVLTVNATDEGPPSNIETGTPYGTIDAPVVTALGGDKEVALNWTKPAAGGYVLNMYTVTWQELGATSLVGATMIIGGDNLSTTISGLTNGVAYEFKVKAFSTIGTSGPQGSATTTPAEPLALVYPPAQVSVDGTLIVSPYAQNIIGTPSYSLINSPPAWVTIDPGTGAVTINAPSVATTQPVDVQLCRSGPPAACTTATLDISVLGYTPSPYISYGAYSLPAGAAITPIIPLVVGFTSPTFSLAPDSEPLPDGLTLDPGTGAITGTPTTATGHFVAPTIRAEEGGTINQEPAPIEVTPTLAYPPIDAERYRATSVTPTTSPAAMPGSFAITSGTLPAGLQIDPSTGVISGTPMVEQTIIEYIEITYTTGNQSVSASVPVSVRGAPSRTVDVTGGPNGLTATLTVTGCNSIVSANFVPAPDAPSKPAGISFPFGLLDFELDDCNAVTDGVLVDVAYSSLIPAGAQFFKEQNNLYSAYPATLSGASTLFALTDNGAGDEDSGVGRIHDPSGIGVPLVDSGTATPVPVLPAWMLWILAVAVGLIGGREARRRL